MSLPQVKNLRLLMPIKLGTRRKEYVIYKHAHIKFSETDQSDYMGTNQASFTNGRVMVTV